MYNIYLLKYNNYFNRILKKKDTIEEYIQAAAKISEPLDCINFNPNDGISTSHTINWSEDWTPDYFLVVDQSKNVKTRWFVTEWVYISGGSSGLVQYQAQLRRDLLADYKDAVLNSPCFVQKGYVGPASPLFYNKEDFTCNQIKDQEALLYDKSKCSWLVAYYDLKAKGDGELAGSVSINAPTDAISVGAATINDWLVYNEYKNGKRECYQGANGFNLYVDMAKTTTEARLGFFLMSSGSEFYYTKGSTPDSETELEYDKDSWSIFTPVDQQITETQDSAVFAINRNKTNVINALKSYKKGTMKATVDAWNGKIIKTNDGRYYRIHFNITISPLVEYIDVNTVNPSEVAVYNAIRDSFMTGSYFSINGWSGNFNKAILVDSDQMYAIMYYDELTDGTYNFDFSNAPELRDMPFGIIAFPFTASDGKSIATDTADILEPTLPLRIIRVLAQKEGVLKDVQLLPFCPIPTLTGSNVSILSQYCIELNLTTTLNSPQYEILKDTNNKIGTVVLFPETNKFSFKIQNYYNVMDNNIKVENQCTFYRLCSPNWSSQYEYSLAKNGAFNNFTVDCTYQPFSPYIHICPEFGNLYGQDFGDARGLICGGEFTIPLATDAWETYKLQNKNYQETFNRQIEKLDTDFSITNRLERQNLALDAAVTVAKGLFSIGDAAGAEKNKGMGMIGATINAEAGLVGIQKRLNALKASEDLHLEQRQYAVDIHNYQLDNIKALPNTLVGVDAYNNNNKIFPVLERYSCTDEEKNIFKDKLKYEGMTINAVGSLISYTDSEELTFVKGQLIRLNDFEGDNHEANAIASEVAQGFYVREDLN